MRLFGFVGLVTLAAGAVGAAGCEGAKSPAVNDDIGWHVGCAQGSSGCTLFPGRAQELMSPTNKRDFDVKCSIDGDNVSFTIKDPGLDPAKSCFAMGQSAGGVHDVLPAGEIVRRIMAEANEAISRMAALQAADRTPVAAE